MDKKLFMFVQYSILKNWIIAEKCVVFVGKEVKKNNV